MYVCVYMCLCSSQKHLVYSWCFCKRWKMCVWIGWGWLVYHMLPLLFTHFRRTHTYALTYTHTHRHTDVYTHTNTHTYTHIDIIICTPTASSLFQLVFSNFRILRPIRWYILWCENYHFLWKKIVFWSIFPHFTWVDAASTLYFFSSVLLNTCTKYGLVYPSWTVCVIWLQVMIFWPPPSTSIVKKIENLMGLGDICWWTLVEKMINWNAYKWILVWF